MVVTCFQESAVSHPAHVQALSQQCCEVTQVERLYYFRNPALRKAKRHALDRSSHNEEQLGTAIFMQVCIVSVWHALLIKAAHASCIVVHLKRRCIGQLGVVAEAAPAVLGDADRRAAALLSAPWEAQQTCSSTSDIEFSFAYRTTNM